MGWGLGGTNLNHNLKTYLDPRLNCTWVFKPNLSGILRIYNYHSKTKSHPM